MLFDHILLQGETIRLEPLASEHKEGLIQAARDGDLWNLSYASCVPSPEKMPVYIHQALTARKQGEEYPFVIVLNSTDTVIGSTRFKWISSQHKKLSIGDSWIAESWQKTAVNTECKYLMLKHAFEECGFNRVEFVAHTINHCSCNALKRIGATQEGVMRQAGIMPDGRVVDMALFSIIVSEWAVIKSHLLSRLTAEFNTYYA